MTILFWHWWILGALCLLIEALSPAFVFLWVGLSAGATGLLLWLAPSLPWQAQLLAFALLTIASVAPWLAWRRRRPLQAGTLNRRGESCLGRTAVLETALAPGRHARLRLDDTTWAASGPALPAGARVRVTAVHGTVLEVAPLT